MSLARFIRRSLRENLLFSVLVELTYRFDLKCFICCSDLIRQGIPLGREEYFRFSKIFARCRC